MLLAGVLHDAATVELLDGWLHQIGPHSPIHDATVARLKKAFAARLPAGWVLSDERLTTADSDPRPDLAVILNTPDRYRTRRPAAEDAAIAIEVADDTLALDRTEKGRLYAQANVPFYLIVNLIDSVVEAYWGPTGPSPRPGYEWKRDHRDGDVPLVLGGQVVAQVPVAELL
jgi:Uma2 family endonuclease